MAVAGGPKMPKVNEIFVSFKIDSLKASISTLALPAIAIYQLTGLFDQF
jgi:hypothetical protein